MNTNTHESVDHYIAEFPHETRELLVQLRATIRNAAPEAEEVISYRMPAYKYSGMLVYFAAYKNHIGFYPGASGIEAFKNELSGYKGAKGSVQFPIEKPLPLDLISEIVKFRINENSKKSEMKAKKTIISLNDKAALILIDIQKGFDDVAYWGNRNNPEAEVNAGRLLNVWRERGLQIFHVKHCSSNPDSKLAPGNPGNEFKEIVAPLAGETVIMKNVNSAFIGTNLKQQLDAMGITKVVIAGLTTDHCISTTVRMAGNYGYDTYVVSDATATFDKEGSDGQKFTAELMHETALASLNGEFAVVVKTEDLLNSLKL